MKQHNASSHAAATLAEQLIAAAGGKEKAIEQIRAAKPKGKVGRPKGLQYRQIDTQLLSLALSLRLQWMCRLPRGRRQPTRHSLIKKVVELCWRDRGVDRRGRRRGRWNADVCTALGLACDGSARLGTDPDATVMRVNGRRRLRPIDIADSRGIDSDYFGSVGIPRVGEITRRYRPPPELWEEFHRARLELQLLPD